MGERGKVVYSKMGDKKVWSEIGGKKKSERLTQARDGISEHEPNPCHLLDDSART